MNADDRAEDIVRASRQDQYAKATKFKEYVAAQITEAEREAVQNKMVEIFEGEDCCVAELERDIYIKGFHAAKEKAAGIAVSCKQAAALSQMGPLTACGLIAERIRAMELEK